MKALEKIARRAAADMVASSDSGTRKPTAAGALNIAHKRPTPGSPSAEALAPGVGQTPNHNLSFHGGRTIQKLTYVNLFVGGQRSWAATDIQNIDNALSDAMTDDRLNEVINQYFEDSKVSTVAKPSQILPGRKPRRVSRASIDGLVRKHVIAANRLSSVDPATTLFNFILPRGVILTDDGGPNASGEERGSDSTSVNTVTTIRSGDTITTITVETTSASGDGKPVQDPDGDGNGPLRGDPDEAESSLVGLGGYHGTVHIGRVAILFSVAVFSETLPSGQDNGIVAFDEPWKNVVATLYHELQETRTDPDVEDAIRTNNENFIGWNSDQGEEIGDFPVFEADPLQEVFKEVALLKGGTAPIQLMYSNRVNGPEDPTI